LEIGDGMQDPFGWGFSTPDDVTAFCNLLVAELEQAVVGQSRGVELLAWWGTRHATGHGSQLALLHGPPATGKTLGVQALAGAMGLPLLHVAVDQLAETNWHGKDLAEYVDDFCASRRVHGDRPVVLLDNLDSILVNRSIYNGGSEQTRAYHAGKQQSLVPLLDGQVISSGWSAAGALVIGVGNLAGIPPGGVTADALYYSGVERPLAERFGSGMAAHFGELSSSSVSRILTKEARSLELELGQMGLRVQIAPEVATVLGRRAIQDSDTGGLRSAVGWLRRAVADAGIRRIRGANAGEEWVLAPDDLDVPAIARPRWID
jgi:hypothetical protein